MSSFMILPYPHQPHNPMISMVTSSKSTGIETRQELSMNLTALQNFEHVSAKLTIQLFGMNS